MRISRTRSFAIGEVAWEKWGNIEANIEFPILRPKANVAPQEPLEEEPKIEGLLFENGLLQEEVQVLQKEVEIWKETCQKQVERRLHTLMEAANQVEGSLSTEEGDELKKVVYPECGEIFSQSRYKVTVHGFVAQKPTQEVGEERGTSTGELRDK